MAEGFLKSFDTELIVYSAGTKPSGQVHPLAVKVMAESGVDISEHFTKDVNQFSHKSFDYVITVCDNAKDECPVFLGAVNNRLHIGFEDPANAAGTEIEKLAAFRKIRDEIKTEFYNFYKSELNDKVKPVF
jgi:arsenate reductase